MQNPEQVYQTLLNQAQTEAILGGNVGKFTKVMMPSAAIFAMGMDIKKAYEPLLDIARNSQLIPFEGAIISSIYPFFGGIAHLEYETWKSDVFLLCPMTQAISRVVQVGNHADVTLGNEPKVNFGLAYFSHLNAVSIITSYQRNDFPIGAVYYPSNMEVLDGFSHNEIPDAVTLLCAKIGVPTIKEASEINEAVNLFYKALISK